MIAVAGWTTIEKTISCFERTRERRGQAALTVTIAPFQLPRHPRFQQSLTAPWGHDKQTSRDRMRFLFTMFNNPPDLLKKKTTAKLVSFKDDSKPQALLGANATVRVSFKTPV